PHPSLRATFSRTGGRRDGVNPLPPRPPLRERGWGEGSILDAAASRMPPHPALRATFSRKGGRRDGVNPLPPRPPLRERGWGEGSILDAADAPSSGASRHLLPQGREKGRA